MHVVILERNKLVGRKVARLFMATGATALAVDEPGQVAAAAGDADVLCADTFDGDLVAEQVRARPGLRGILWTAEPLRRSLRYLVETTAIDHVLGRRDFESPPRAWELLMIARRFTVPAQDVSINRPVLSIGLPARTPAAPVRIGSPLEDSGTQPPLSAYLDWGAHAIELEIRSTADRDAAVTRIQELVGMLAVPRRIAEMFGELGHELIMNAIYDAPVDAEGRPRYAGDRKAEIVLEAHERSVIRIGTDGTRLALQVRDPFGRLERRHVFDGLARGLAGEMDHSHGGAGLGMMVCHNASSAMFFDVARGRHTEVTALFELDQNLREFRTQARSLHFWSR